MTKIMKKEMSVNMTANTPMMKNIRKVMPTRSQHLVSMKTLLMKKPKEENIYEYNNMEQEKDEKIWKNLMMTMMIEKKKMKETIIPIQPISMTMTT